MLRFETPVFPQLGDGTLEGEAADSFELSEDKLRLTFKIRQGMKWDARDPTNGRVLDTQDVLFSWKKFEELNQSAGNMSHGRSPSAHRVHIGSR
jgi:ABC-type transport system substrate-binding protein